jgi:hypothetical protein
MPGGELERFSHDWGDGLQTSPGGSWYMGEGYVSFSGGLNPTIPIERIERTEETRDGCFWLFHHNFWGTGRGVDFRAPCRVYRVKGAL